jgi:hypothetical protein
VRIEWVHAISTMLLMLVFALVLDRTHAAPLPLWVGIPLAIPVGLFAWFGPMFFWSYVYRRMGWEIPPDEDDEISN